MLFLLSFKSRISHFFPSTLSLFSQEKTTTIEYDKSGNRVLRSSLTLEAKNGSMSNSVADTLQFADALSGFTFALFPNPAEQEVSISTQPEFVQQGAPVLYLYDLIGKLILQKNFNRAQETLDMRAVKSGAYVLKLRTNDVDVTE